MCCTFRLSISLLGALASAPALAGDGASTARLKAALVYNVIKFVSFPRQEQGELHLCVLNDGDEVTQAMYALQGRPVQTQRIAVQKIKQEAELDQCQVLFLSAADDAALHRFLQLMRNKPVLSISDLNPFTENGGVVGLYTDGDKLKLKINIDASKRAGLTVAAPLLNLAQVIREGGN